MRISVDLDGVLCDYIAEYLRIFSKRFNKDIKHIGDWKISSILDISKTESNQIFRDIVQSECELVDKNAPKYLEKINQGTLLSDSHEVDIVTIKFNVNKKKDIEKFLVNSGIEQGKHYNYLHVLKYHSIPSKLDYGGYDLYIDDNPNLAEKAGKEGKARVFLFNQPWNWKVECEKYSNVIRVKDWKEIYDNL